jgi:hypothetical protein
MRTNRRLVLVIISLVLGLHAARSSAAPHTMLMCESARTLRVPPLTTFDAVDVIPPDFAALGCQLSGSSRELCVPMAMTNASPPLAGPPFSAPDLTLAYSCYRLMCPSGPLPNRHEVVDGLGAGQEDFFPGGVTSICIPAVLEGGSHGTRGDSADSPGQPLAGIRAAPHTMLKCQRDRTPRLPPLTMFDALNVIPSDFAASGCQLVSAFSKQLCTPMVMTNVTPPLAGPMSSAPDLTRDYSCYRITCSSGPTPNPHMVVDGLGAGQEFFVPGGVTNLCIPAVVDDCTGGTCGNYADTCHPSGACRCFTLSRRQAFCAVPTACADTFPCRYGLQDSHFGCPEGFVCVDNSCCGPHVCVPAASVCAAGDPPPPSPAPGIKTTASPQGRVR